MKDQFETVFKVGDSVTIKSVPGGCRPEGFLKANKGIVYEVQYVDQQLGDNNAIYSLTTKHRPLTPQINFWGVLQENLRHAR